MSRSFGGLHFTLRSHINSKSIVNYRISCLQISLRPRDLFRKGKINNYLCRLGGKSEKSTKSLKRRAELLSHLKALPLPTDGTVPVLRQRLNDHLGAISKSIVCEEHVQINPNRLSKPSAICAASNDLLFCSDDERSQYAYQITLTSNGVTIHD